MNIAYLVGNGFDLNLALKTSYDDFYHYFIDNCTSQEECVLNLKQEINAYVKTVSKSSFINWADFETGFGKYTRNISSFSDLVLIYKDIIISLHNYIKHQESLLGVKNEGKLKKDLIFPFYYLREVDKLNAQTFISRFNKDDYKVNIITFNYTNSIEKILGIKKANHLKIGYNHRGKPCWLNSILHIHGNIDDNILFGVNDVSQLENDNFINNHYALDLLIKPMSNKVIGSRIDEECIKIIEISNLVCLFGLSLGDSDKSWWNLIGEQLLRTDFRLIYFVKDEDLSIKQFIGKKIDYYKNFLLAKTTLSNKEKEEAKEKIYIAYNTDMFKL